MGSISLRNVSLTAAVPLFRDLNLVIADGDRDIRVAFSSAEIGELPQVYSQMAAAARDLLG